MISVGIADSSPIIALERIGRLDLLQGHFERLLIPAMVAQEIGDVPEWMTITSIMQPRVVDVFPSSIHKGEAEVIVLGMENPKAVLILDDWHAREFARSRNFPIIGIIGLIIRARRDGRIDAVLPILHQLNAVGFHVSDKLLAEARRLVNE